MKQAILVLLTAWLCQAGALRVLVRDPSGAAIANATVRAGAAAQLTDAAGEARFTGLPAGRVTVAIEADGFAPYTTRVQVRDSLTTFERKLVLAPRTDQVEVGVDPREDATDPRGNFGATELTPQQIEQLPDDPDELERVLQEMAGPGAVMRVNGFRGGRLPHKSQIQSIRFRLTPYSAEEHDDGFMLVDIQTKPGLGEWHGDISFAFGDDSLNARNAFAPRREPQQMRRLDMNLMGPMIKNRTSTSFNFSRNDGYDARTSKGFLPDGPFTQLIRLPNEAINAGVRLQHALNRSHILRAEYQFEQSDRSSAANFDLPERASTTFSRLHQLRVSTLGSISEKSVNELRFQGQWTDNGTSSLTAAPAIIVQGAFHAGGANADSNRVTRAIELTDHVSFNRGKHSFRAGVQIDHLRHQGRDFTNGFGTTVYPSLQAYLANQPVLSSLRSAEVTVGYLQNRAAVYFQDDIRVLKSFNVSMGLRHEAMSQIGDRLNAAPRVGFAWSPFKHGKTTLRGGSGIFNRWYEASLYEETLRLNGAAQADLITSAAGARLPGIVRSAESLNMPYVVRSSIGVQQELPGRLNLVVEYRNERGFQQFRSRNVNYPDSGYGYFLQLENGARSRLDGLMTRISLMPSPEAKGLRSRLFFNAMYLWSRSRDEVSNPLVPPFDSQNARADWGPSMMDVRHRFNTLTQITLPRGWQAGAFLNVSSALPYNVTTGFDSNGDTFFNDRPAGVGRNAGRGAAQVNLSARVAWNRGFGTRGGDGGGGPQVVRLTMDGSGRMPDLPGRGTTRANALVKMQLYLAATNLLNRTNETGFVGIATSPLFGLASMAQPPRRLELGMRFSF